MAFPIIFAQLAAGVQPLVDFDQMFGVVGSMGTVFCTATGSNAIALAPSTNMPTISAYANYQAFGFVAVASSTGAVTINVNGVGALPAYAPDSVTQLASGNISTGVYYLFSYNSILNSGAGGFQLTSASPSAAVLSSLVVTTAGSNIAQFNSTGSHVATITINDQAGGQGAALQFSDAGSNKWNLGIDTANDFFLTDAVGSKEFLSAVTGSGMNVWGSPAADNAPAGYVGEYIQSNVLISSGVSLTSGTAANVTSISLSAGDWDVAGSVIIGPNGAGTLSAFNGAISTVSGTAPIGATGNGQAFLGGLAITGAAQQLIAFGPTRINVSTTTPVFLIAGANFSAGTCVAGGNIRARRVR